MPRASENGCITMLRRYSAMLGYFKDKGKAALLVRQVFQKIFVSCLLVTLLFSAFTGCGQNTYGLNPQNPVVLTIWHYYNGAQKMAFDNMVQEFNETVGKEQGILLEAFSQGSVNDLTNAVKNAANREVGAQEMPDIFATYVDTTQEIDSMGLLASLDPYFSKDELTQYIEAYIDEGRFDAHGNLKVFPVAKSTEVLLLNKTDWNAFSEKTDTQLNELYTWEGIVRTAEKYYAYSGGKAFFGRDAFANYVIVGSKQLGMKLSM